jgi:hypothetical protein
MGWRAIGLAALVWLPLGCATPKTKVPAAPPVAAGSDSRIDELNLVAMPVAVNLDAVPGPDGFIIKVFAADQSRPKPKPISTGALEVLMFDGFFDSAKLAANQYRHLWTFSASQLKGYEFTATIGTGYNLTLAWGEDKPREDNISVLVRYRPLQGPLVYSAPSAITVSTR